MMNRTDTSPEDKARAAYRAALFAVQDGLLDTALDAGLGGTASGPGRMAALEAAGLADVTDYFCTFEQWLALHPVNSSLETDKLAD